MESRRARLVFATHIYKTLIDTPVCVYVYAYVYMSYYEKNDGLEKS
jgi:hypothetical protein